jgi:uridine phosphorylase
MTQVPEKSIPIQVPPILGDKRHGEPSAFTPESLLREARRQKKLGDVPVPRVCVLDPDGDLAGHVQARGIGTVDPHWACYHTKLHRFALDGLQFGVVPHAVGAPFAVLVSEQLFASGCELLISVTSAGQLRSMRPPPYFVLIERALRDEGTSYHYLPPGEFSELDPELLAKVAGAFVSLGVPVDQGAVWTTDAPYRETQSTIDLMAGRGLLAVEMEAAALYAFSKARRRPVLCFAHVTNQMGSIEGDFEKGEASGAIDALSVVLATAQAWLGR